VGRFLETHQIDHLAPDGLDKLVHSYNQFVTENCRPAGLVQRTPSRRMKHDGAWGIDNGWMKRATLILHRCACILRLLSGALLCATFLLAWWMWVVFACRDGFEGLLEENGKDYKIALCLHCVIAISRE
jgi:hypothetical protein